MKVTKITFSTTPFILDESAVQHLLSLGCSETIARHEENRNHMIRELLGDNFIEWAAIFEGENEVMYLNRVPGKGITRTLDDLKARGVITDYAVVTLK
jgi:hypothetical protein